MEKKNLNTYKLISLLFIVSITIYMGFGFFAQQADMMKYKKQISKVQEEIKDVDDDLKDLKNQQKNYKDDQYIEKIARERLKMVKPGEYIYIDINKNAI